MNIDFAVGAIDNISFSSLPAKKIAKQEEGLFEKFYNAALNVVNETNQYQKEAEKLQSDLAAGKTEDILAVMIAQEKAYASLNFTLQVTTKVVEAYREIMRMQV